MCKKKKGLQISLEEKGENWGARSDNFVNQQSRNLKRIIHYLWDLRQVT